MLIKVLAVLAFFSFGSIGEGIDVLAGESESIVWENGWFSGMLQLARQAAVALGAIVFFIAVIMLIIALCGFFGVPEIPAG